MPNTDAPPVTTAGGRYNGVAMALHWLIAGLLIWNILIAWSFEDLRGVARIAPTQLHKSIGITVLLLSLVRLGWRFVRPPPPLPATIRGWERGVAHVVYVLFYVVMIGLPVTGRAMVSASRLIHVFPITLFNVVPWPAIAPLSNLPADQMRTAHEGFEIAHGLLGKLSYLQILLHVGAALRHLVLLRDGVVGRMIPFLPTPKSPS